MSYWRGVRSLYRPDDLKVEEPLEVVRRLENLFFGEDGFSAERAIELIRAEARACDVHKLQVEESDGWWVVAASRDWLPPEGELRVFTEVVHFPEWGVNASRPEILLTAFARVVLTSHDGTVTVIVDSPARADEATKRFAEWFARDARVIVFLP